MNFHMLKDEQHFYDYSFMLRNFITSHGKASYSSFLPYQWQFSLKNKITNEMHTFIQCLPYPCHTKYLLTALNKGPFSQAVASAPHLVSCLNHISLLFND